MIYAYTTSFFGAVFIAHGIGYYAGGFPNMILNGQAPEWDATYMAYIGGIIVVTILGA